MLGVTHRKNGRLENHEIAKFTKEETAVCRLSLWSQSACLLEEAPLVGAAEYFKLTPFQVSKVREPAKLCATSAVNSKIIEKS